MTSRKRTFTAAVFAAISLAGGAEAAAAASIRNHVELPPDRELLELVELEVRELLRQYEFPGDPDPTFRVVPEPERPLIFRPDRTESPSFD